LIFSASGSLPGADTSASVHFNSILFSRLKKLFLHFFVHILNTNLIASICDK
jgi:hypothetical protein